MSLTPHARNQEATDEAMNEGYLNGFMTMIPSSGALYIAMQNPTFRKRTNWQSRTALVVMPALFAFAFTAEHRLTDKMREIAYENDHRDKTVDWAERQLETTKSLKSGAFEDKDTEKHLTELYNKSVRESSGVNIVPGDQLGTHHKMANFVAANPMKTLASLAVPSVAWILYGRTGKEHLTFSIKLLHTRVFGQFITLGLLLSVMGFKEFMDSNGKFITEAEADYRVQEMHRVRQSLIRRLEVEKQHQNDLKKELADAHEQDIQDGKQKKKKSNKSDAATVVNVM